MGTTDDKIIDRFFIGLKDRTEAIVPSNRSKTSEVRIQHDDSRATELIPKNSVSVDIVSSGVFENSISDFLASHGIFSVKELLEMNKAKEGNIVTALLKRGWIWRDE